MAKISELNDATSLTGTELIPIVQNGITKKVTANDFFNNGNIVASGQYNPNVTHVSGMGITYASRMNYIRIGRFVNVTGSCLYELTTAPVDAPYFRLDLPIASNYADTNDISGVATFTYFQDMGAGYKIFYGALVQPCDISGTLELQITLPENLKSDVSGFELSYSFQYKIN